MTIYEIKKLTKETSPYFFDEKTMKFFGQSMRDFKVTKELDGRYMIYAPVISNGSVVSHTKRFFNPINNELECK